MSRDAFSLGTWFGLMLLLVVCVSASLALILPSPASAVTDSEEIGTFGGAGFGAGSLYMASDPVSGHLYTLAGNRIAEFTAWGEFVKAFGWGVVDGKAELETCASMSTCLQGIPGPGKGQFNQPLGLAVDGSGNLYVLDHANDRVQKFDSSGHFILMFGANVDKTTGANVCTAASDDDCQAGAAGNGPGEFSSAGFGALAINQTANLLVGSGGRIEEFEPDGAFKSEFDLPAGTTVDAIAPDPTGSDLYVILNGGIPQNLDDVRKLNSSGGGLGSLKVYQPKSIATDASGNLYVVQTRISNNGPPPEEVIEFGSHGNEVSTCCTVPNEDNFNLTGLATNAVGDLYVANNSNNGTIPGYITFYGPPPVKWPPPPVPPQILAQFPATVDSTSATLKAQINPNFIADTRFYLEYGPAPCAAGACTKQPAPPGLLLGAGAVKKAITSSGIVLTGLSPRTTYYYRFVAQSSGGGPVYGVDPDGSEPQEASFAEGLDGTFTTFPAGHPPDSCPNQAFRTGPSAALPDCRAYEMVSPVDKSNGDILTRIDITGFETQLNQAATDGEALTYSSYRPFGGAQGGPYANQYLARRGAGGWASEALGVALNGSFYGAALAEDEFKAFSPDLCHSWLAPGGEATLAPGETPGFPNLYRRDNCPEAFEALTTAPPPPPRLPRDYIPELQGFSADGSKAIFRVQDKLTEDARGDDGSGHHPFQVYEASGGALKVVCVLPEGTSAKAEAEFPNCSAGSPSDIPAETAINRTASLSHAISEDGSRIYWSASVRNELLGKIYLRLNGATTLPVSESNEAGGGGKTTTKPAQFWGASADGSKALYVVADPEQAHPSAKDKNLYRYDLGTEESTMIAPEVTAVVATSEDLFRVYFVSETVLPGTSGAAAGEENLYLDDEGAETFIATLSTDDIAPSIPSDGSTRPIFHVARATTDGAHLTFVSTRPLTGLDNTDINSGEADSEVFSYDALSDKLACASCSPAGVRPAGRKGISQGGRNVPFWTAGSLPAPQSQLNVPRPLSEDGTKLFFTSYPDLLPADTNGNADVYEWEALGGPSCSAESDPDYYPANGGCLFLISSGESSSDSELIDTAADGRDVFFTTNSSLLPQDPGLIDVYDARAGGGFPPPAGQPAVCEGEACQGPVAPPSDPTPGSASFEGAGNVKAGPPARCAKGKARRKGRCVAKKQRQHKHAESNRRKQR